MADYYSDSNTSGDETSADTPAQDNSTDSTDTQDQDQDEKDGESFLVSKSALSGHEPKVGDICKFKVESILQDEIEFSYVKHDENKNDSSDNEDMQKSNSELESMAA